MSSELRQPPSMRRDARSGIDSLELPQQFARLCQRCGRRWIEPAQTGGINRAPATEFESQRGEIRVQDFRRCLRRE
jgi:hypothetical protein